MKLNYLLKERIDGGIGAASTGYLGKFPALQSVYNWGYKGYYKGPELDLTPELDAQSQNQLIDQAIDLLYSKFPEAIENKKLKRHVLQMLIGKVTQGELRDKVDMDTFIKRLKKTKGVETV
tara:strand:- start:1058 stop:1420 length:363 start_codon:yes stop_codon:yes gene_type:complete